MADPSLPDLEAERERLYAQLAAVGDFRRGSVAENYRRSGKPNCACARPMRLSGEVPTSAPNPWRQNAPASRSTDRARSMAETSVRSFAQVNGPA